MNNNYEETTTQSLGKNFSEALKGLVFGPILILLALALIYWNEGRINLSKIAQKAIQISNTEKNKNSDFVEKLVSTTGLIKTDEKISDDKFLIPEKYLALKRTVFMYSWQEIKSTKTETSLKGEKTTHTIYDYKKAWSENPENSSNFKVFREHQNPAKSISNFSNKTKKVYLGIYKIDMSKITFPKFISLKLSSQNINSPQASIIENKNCIFISKNGESSIDTPNIGDLCIYYSILPVKNEYTLIGKLKSEQIIPYFCKDNSMFYRLFYGTKENAVQSLSSEHKQISWTIRLITLLMIWIGFMLLLGPILNVLEIIPIIGSVTKLAIALITFIISLLLWGSSIFIFMVLNNILAMVLAITLLIAIVIFSFFYYRKKKKVQLEQ